MLFFLQWNFFFSKLLPRYFAPKTLFNIELLFSSFDGAGEEKNLILLRRQKHAERERERERLNIMERQIKREVYKEWKQQIEREA